MGNRDRGPPVPMNEGESSKRASVWKTTGIGVAVGVLLFATLVTIPAAVRPATDLALPAITTNSCGVGSLPYQPAYDPSNHYIYVPNQGSHNVTVVTPNCKTVASIALPSSSDPTSAVYDPSDNWVYVADTNLSQLYAISGTSIKKTITSSLFDQPWNPIYDPGEAGLIVPDFMGRNVTFVQGSSVVENIPVGIEPHAVVYDPYYGTLLVANEWTNNVTILSAVTLAHVADVPVGTTPGFIAYDPADQLDYVDNYNGYNITLLTGDGGQAGSIYLGTFAVAVLFDQKNLDIYAACDQARYLQVIHGTSLVRTEIFVLPSADPTGEVFVDFTNMVYVTDPYYDLLYIMP